MLKLSLTYAIIFIILPFSFNGAAIAQTWTVYNENNSNIPSSFVSDIAIDTSNTLWVATNGGLGRFDSISWTTYDYTNSGIPITSNNTCLAVFVDDSQYVWLGTDYGHLLKFDMDTSWIDYTIIGFGDVHVIRQDLSKNFWVGHSYGLKKFDGTTWTDHTSNLPSYYVTCFNPGPDSVLWVGTNQGLAKLSPANVWTTYTVANSPLTSDWIEAVKPGPDGSTWIGTRDGAYHLDSLGTWTKYNSSNTILWDDEVHSIDIDSDSMVWITNDAASIATYENGLWSNIFFPLNFSFSRVILIDLHGKKWIGAQTGLAKYDDGGSGPITTAIEEPGSPVFVSVFPNPCNDFLNIRIDEGMHLDLRLMNIQGMEVRKVSEANPGAGPITINMTTSNLSEGVYFLHIATLAGVTVNKIIIER